MDPIKIYISKNTNTINGDITYTALAEYRSITTLSRETVKDESDSDIEGYTIESLAYELYSRISNNKEIDKKSSEFKENIMHMIKDEHLFEFISLFKKYTKNIELQYEIKDK